MRELKFHEKKLLRKVDFLEWKSEANTREIAILRRYHIQRREDYVAYNKLCGAVTKIVAKLKLLPSNDEVRIKTTIALLDKLYLLGIIPNKRSLEVLEHLAASAFCRRRLPVVMCKLKMAETLREAVTFVEQGHVRVGPMTLTDPAYIVSRAMEDFVTWTDTSKIRKKVLAYNDQLDDYDEVQP